MSTSSRPLLSLAAGALTLLAQHGQTGLQNPFNRPADVEAGRLLYRANCAVCHGIDGSGGRGPGFTSGVFRRGGSDEALFRTVSNGIPGTEMPPIFFEGRQMWQLIAFLRSLSAGRAMAHTKGNPERGENIFTGKGGCLACHAVNGRGSRAGPDLSDIGSGASLAELEASLLRPDEKILPQHWQVRAVTADGRVVTGRRLNEDTYSVQILDSQERLVSLIKSTLARYEVVKSSLMPSYESRLTRQELDDLIAYLAVLRR